MALRNAKWLDSRLVGFVLGVNRELFSVTKSIRADKKTYLLMVGVLLASD